MYFRGKNAIDQSSFIERQSVMKSVQSKISNYEAYFPEDRTTQSPIRVRKRI